MPFTKKVPDTEKKEEIDLADSPLVKKEEAKAEQKEAPAKKKERDFGITIDPSKTYVFQTLIKSPIPRHQILGVENKINDAVTGRIRVIRYIPQAESIFADEQDAKDPNLKTVSNTLSLSFYRDEIIASGTDTRLVEYLLSHDMYDGNKNRLSGQPPLYTLLDKDLLVKKDSDRHGKELAALNAIEDYAMDDLIPVARIVLGISETDRDAVKNELRAIAKKPQGKDENESGAERILNNLENPMVKRSYFLQRGIDEGVIRVDTANGRAIWCESGATICAVTSKQGRHQVNELAKFSLTDEGQKFYTLLRTKV